MRSIEDLKAQQQLLADLRASGDPAAARRADALQGQYYREQMGLLSEDVYESAQGKGQPPAGWIRASENSPMLRQQMPQLSGMSGYAVTILRATANYGEDHMKDSRSRHGAQSPSGWMRSMSTRQNILRCLFGVMLSISITGCATVRADERDAQPEALLDQIWPFQLRFQPYKRPLSKQDQEYAEAALIQWLESYLEPGYKVVDKRFFWAHRKYQAWVPVSKGHALYPENEKGRWQVLEEIEQSWRTPGSGLVRLWKVNIDGKDHYFAVAMTEKPVPGTRGRRLFARFELEKLID